MTTDPFNTANSYFDEMPHHLADHCDHAGVRKACRECRQKFDASAQWARVHLAEKQAAEVQAAKAEAWQEGVNFALPNAETTWYPQHNPYRTTEHETGDQA